MILEVADVRLKHTAGFCTGDVTANSECVTKLAADIHPETHPITVDQVYFAVKTCHAYHDNRSEFALQFFTSPSSSRREEHVGDGHEHN